MRFMHVASHEMLNAQRASFALAILRFWPLPKRPKSEPRDACAAHAEEVSDPHQNRGGFTPPCLGGTPGGVPPRGYPHTRGGVPPPLFWGCYALPCASRKLASRGPLFGRLGNGQNRKMANANDSLFAFNISCDATCMKRKHALDLV